MHHGQTYPQKIFRECLFDVSVNLCCHLVCALINVVEAKLSGKKNKSFECFTDWSILHIPNTIHYHVLRHCLSTLRFHNDEPQSQMDNPILMNEQSLFFCSGCYGPSKFSCRDSLFQNCECCSSIFTRQQKWHEVSQPNIYDITISWHKFVCSPCLSQIVVLLFGLSNTRQTTCESDRGSNWYQTVAMMVITYSYWCKWRETEKHLKRGAVQPCIYPNL